MKLEDLNQDMQNDIPVSSAAGLASMEGGHAENCLEQFLPSGRRPLFESSNSMPLF